MKSRPSPTADRTARRGLTLVEIVVALSLLGGVLLPLGAFSYRLAQSTGNARLIATASQLVADRIETSKGAPKYTALDTMRVTENPVKGYAGFTRQTWVQHIGGAPSDSVDYRVVTVEVRHARMTRSLRKSTIIAPF